MSTVTCPGCGKRGKFPPHFVGKPIKCRVCGSRFTAAADADDPIEVPSTSPKPPAFDLQSPPANQQEEVLEPLVIEKPATDKPADCGINLARPADSGIDLGKKPVIGHQTFETYLSAVNAYMARKDSPPPSPLPAQTLPASWKWKTVAATTASLAMLVSLMVIAAVFWPRQAETNPSPPSTPAIPLTASEIFDRASPAVVSIEVRDKNGKVISQGSGFFVSTDGLVVTNFHVVFQAHSAEVIFKNMRLRVEGLAGMQRPDLALLKVSGKFPALELAEEGMPVVGTKVYAIGAPQGLPETMSDGIISGHRSLSKAQYPYLQTTTPISPGSSGGPLLSDRGKVVGVTTLSRVDGQNLNFAIPSSLVRELVTNRYPPMDLALLQVRITQSKYVELTETDIVLAKHFRSNKAAFFGVGVGMSRAEAEAALQEAMLGTDLVVSINWKQEDYWEVGRRKAGTTHAIVSFDFYAGVVTSILVKSPDYLVGNSKRLFSFNPKGDIDDLQSFLGKAIVTTTPNVYTWYSFPNAGIEVNHWYDGTRTVKFY